MPEKQSQHRQQLERTVVESNCRLEARAQTLAFILTLVIVGTGAYLLATGESIQGFAAIIVAIGSLSATFLYARRTQPKERAEELKAVPAAGGPPSG